jgi:large subunit ribosomal protein L32
MGVPKKRRSHSKTGKRRSHHALKKMSFTMCAQCGEPTLPHRICSNCQSYRGKKILNTEA